MEVSFRNNQKTHLLTSWLALIFFTFVLLLSNIFPTVSALSEKQKRILQSDVFYFNEEVTTFVQEQCSATNSPTTPAATTPGNVYMVGDSIGVGAESALTAAFQTRSWTLTANVLGGRTLAQGLEVVDQDTAKIAAAKAVIIELGTNNGGFTEANVGAMIDKIRAAAPTVSIYWIDTAVLSSRPDVEYWRTLNAVNGIIQSQAVAKNYEVISWNKAVFGESADPSDMQNGTDTNGYIRAADQYVHLTPAGNTAFTSLIVSAAASGGAGGETVNLTVAGNCSCGGSSPVVAGDPEQNKTSIYAFLIGKGLTPIQAAGIMGNMQAESHFEPRLVEYGFPNSRGEISKLGSPTSLDDVIPPDANDRGQPGYGLAQWSGGRKDALAAFAAAQGQSESDLGLQLDFFWQELTVGYRTSVYEPLLASTTLEEATYIILEKYERPANIEGNKPIRLGYAEIILNELGSGGTVVGGATAAGSCNYSLSKGAPAPVKVLDDKYIAKVFATDIFRVRDLTFSPGGTLLASSLAGSEDAVGKVYALPDKNGDGVADEVKFLFEKGRSHGIAFYQNKLYVSENTEVSVYNWDEASLTATYQEKLFDLNTGVGEAHLHASRSLVITPAGMLYVGLGVNCNGEANRDDRCDISETAGTKATAQVWAYNIATNGPERVYSLGLRNPAFLTYNSSQNNVWVTENSLEDWNLAPTEPPDEINVLGDGQHYGFPYCFGDQPIAYLPPYNCDATARPAYSTPGHAAPLGLKFVENNQQFSQYNGDLFVAYHGNFNDQNGRAGDKIVRLDVSGTTATLGDTFIDFDNGTSTLNVADCSGGRGGHCVDYKYRPADIEFDNKGSMFVSDDWAGAVYIIQNKAATGVGGGAAIDTTGIYADSTEVPCDNRTVDVGVHEGYHNLVQVPVRLCALPNLTSTSEESGGGALGIPGANGKALVNSRVSGAFYELVAAANNSGRLTGGATSSYRTMEHQQRLCEDNPGCANGSSYSTVAQPGTSNHQMGLAIDFRIVGIGNSRSNCVTVAGICTAQGYPDWEWLNTNATRFGIKQYKNEFWHFSPSGN